MVPLLFYNGPEKYTGSRDIRELIAAPNELIEAVFLKPIPLIDLHDIEDEDLRESQRAGIMQFCMKHVYAKEILNYIQHILESAKFIWHNGERDLSMIVLKYILSQARTADPACLVKVLKADLKEEDDIMGTLAYYLAQEYKDIWLQEGESTLVIRLLKKKFKVVPEGYLRRVEQASQEDLLKWADRILESKSLKEVFED